MFTSSGLHIQLLEIDKTVGQGGLASRCENSVRYPQMCWGATLYQVKKLLVILEWKLERHLMLPPSPVSLAKGSVPKIKMPIRATIRRISTIIFLRLRIMADITTETGQPKAKVLLAEDDRVTRLITSSALAKDGYQVVEVENGGAAYDKAISERPNIILLDVNMPVMDGFEVLSKLRAHPSTVATPVILITSLLPEQGEADGLRLGANYYLTKPVDADAVRLVARVALKEVEKAARDSKVSREVIGIENEILDGKLGGGIPLGSLALIEGASAAGKSVLCQHFTYAALMKQASVAYFTFENTTQTLVDQMASIGMAVSGYLQTDRLSIFPLEEPELENGPETMMLDLVEAMEELPARYKLTIVDAITNFLAFQPAEVILKFCYLCKRMCRDGRIIILVAHSSTFEEKTLVRLGALCDVQLRMGVEKVGAKLVKSLEVCKIHNAELGTGSIVPFDIEPGLGMRISPVNKAQA